MSVAGRVCVCVCLFLQALSLCVVFRCSCGVQMPTQLTVNHLLSEF